MLMALAVAAGCSRSTEKPVIQTKTIVLDYRNGWYHEADGIQTIEAISRRYRRDARFVAQLNYTTAAAVPTQGKLLYIPPSNDRTYVRAALQRVQGRPELVPTIPWDESLLQQQQQSTQPPQRIEADAGDRSRKKRVSKPEVKAADGSKVVRAGSSRAKSSVVGWSRKAPRDDGQFKWPVRGQVVTRFREGWNKACHGLEIQAPEGSPVISTRSGRVLVAQEYPGYGKMIVIDHGDGYASVYGYNSSVFVTEDDMVESGQKIATVGRTSYGDSGKLFFQIRRNAQPIDPMEFLQ